jgi:hypothetical protein
MKNKEQQKEAAAAETFENSISGMGQQGNSDGKTENLCNSSLCQICIKPKKKLPQE